MATGKKLSTRGDWEDPQPHYLFWDPLYISETNRARTLKFGTLVGIYEHWGSVKKKSARCTSGEISSPQFLCWDPFHISETNKARKLKFGTLVGIGSYYNYM